MTDDKAVVGHYGYHPEGLEPVSPDLFQRLEAIAKAEALADHIAWMREHVRCETCKWKRLFFQGFIGEEKEEVLACGNRDGPWYMSPAGGRESCATHWEPRP